MQYYTFPISVQAYSQREAEAKLKLLLVIGAVLVDFKIGDLACAFIKSKLLEAAGKVAKERRSQAFAEFMKEWQKKYHEKADEQHGPCKLSLD